MKIKGDFLKLNIGEILFKVWKHDKATFKGGGGYIDFGSNSNANERQIT